MTAAASAGGAQLALMNPGGIRGDLIYAGSSAGEGDGNVTYGEAFTVQPFGNLLVSMTLTGSQIERALEQQWVTQTDGSVRFLHLGVSQGFAYSWSASAPRRGQDRPRLDHPQRYAVDPVASYRVTVNSFLADGGDGFTVLREGTDRVGGGVDLDALTAYLGANARWRPRSRTGSPRCPDGHDTERPAGDRLQRAVASFGRRREDDPTLRLMSLGRRGTTRSGPFHHEWCHAWHAG